MSKSQCGKCFGYFDGRRPYCSCERDVNLYFRANLLLKEVYELDKNDEIDLALDLLFEQLDEMLYNDERPLINEILLVATEYDFSAELFIGILQQTHKYSFSNYYVLRLYVAKMMRRRNWDAEWILIGL